MYAFLEHGWSPKVLIFSSFRILRVKNQIAFLQNPLSLNQRIKKTHTTESAATGRITAPAEISWFTLCRAQFPSDSVTKDGIDVAYELIADSASRLLVANIPNLAEIDVAETKYQSAQSAILALKEREAATIDEVMTELLYCSFTWLCYNVKIHRIGSLFNFRIFLSGAFFEQRFKCMLDNVPYNFNICLPNGGQMSMIEVFLLIVHSNYVISYGDAPSGLSVSL